MPAGCTNTCPKVKEKTGSTEDAESFNHPTADLNESSNSGPSSRGAPSQSPKSVHLGEATSDEVTDSRSTKDSDNTTSAKDSRTSTSSQTEFAKKSVKTSTNGKSSARSIPRKESPRKIERHLNHSRMSSRAGNSSRSGTRTRTRGDWDPNGHDPCPPSCPTTQARDRATRKAELRQERLDYYLVNKGFRYFDDLCTCSSLCLFNQFKRDRFVVDFLKSTILFGIGMKLCEELDAWNIIG